jgi:hypothetical protein
MRENWLSNRVFKSFDDTVDHRCYAWNTENHLHRPPRLSTRTQINYLRIGIALYRQDPKESAALW